MEKTKECICGKIIAIWNKSGMCGDCSRKSKQQAYKFRDKIKSWKQKHRKKN